MNFGADTNTDRAYDYMEDVMDAEREAYENYLDETMAVRQEDWRDDEGFLAWQAEQRWADAMEDAAMEDRYFDPWE